MGCHHSTATATVAATETLVATRDDGTTPTTDTRSTHAFLQIVHVTFRIFSLCTRVMILVGGKSTGGGRGSGIPTNADQCFQH